MSTDLVTFYKKNLDIQDKRRIFATTKLIGTPDKPGLVAQLVRATDS